MNDTMRPKLKRTARSLHRANCPAVRQSAYRADFIWPMGMSVAEMRKKMRWHDLTECQRCYPLLQLASGSGFGAPHETPTP